MGIIDQNSVGLTGRGYHFHSALHAGNIAQHSSRLFQFNAQLQGTADGGVVQRAAAGVDADSIARSIYEFSPVEHRLEPVREVEGVLYINDSKATNVDSVWYALESMTRPVVWIAGGTDKGNDYSPLKEFARKKVKALICMGLDNEKLVRDFTDIVPTVVSTSSLDEAMRAAVAVAERGDVVLLSPACASFDLFKNYENRGQLFKEWVKSNI